MYCLLNKPTPQRTKNVKRNFKTAGLRFTPYAVLSLNSHPDQLSQRGKTLFQRLSGRIDDGVGLAVERLARVENALEISYGFIVAGHRPQVALRHHSRYVLFRPSFQPHCV